MIVDTPIYGSSSKARILLFQRKKLFAQYSHSRSIPVTGTPLLRKYLEMGYDNIDNGCRLAVWQNKHLTCCLNQH